MAIELQGDEAIRKFLDKVLNSRIATELLCKHHIALQKENVNSVYFSF